MKVLATVTFEIPDTTDNALINDRLETWLATADYLVQREKPDPNSPTTPCLQDFRVQCDVLPRLKLQCPVCDSVEVVNVLDLNDERVIYRCSKCGTKFEEKIGEDA